MTPVLVVALVAVACGPNEEGDNGGGSGITCGEGTTLQDGECISIDEYLSQRGSSSSGDGDGDGDGDDGEPDGTGAHSGDGDGDGDDSGTGATSSMGSGGDDAGAGGNPNSTGGADGSGGQGSESTGGAGGAASSGGAEGTGGTSTVPLGGSPSSIPEDFGGPCFSHGGCLEQHCLPEGACAACLMNADCKAGEFCEGGLCITGTQCVNTLDCPLGTVCDPASDVCVYCIDDADCPGDHTCIENYCKPMCDSDHDCRARGELCYDDTHCAECADHDDCASSEYCDSYGICREDHCSSGSACAWGYQYLCEESGGGYSVDSTCPSLECNGPVCAE